MTTQKDIAELKKRFTQEECTITRFAGAYVDANKNIVTSFNKNFLSLDDTEFKKYLEIIKAIYSNKLEDNMLTLEFNPYDVIQSSSFLLKLVDEGLKEDASVEQLIGRIINDYKTTENYLILLFHDNYDIIKHAADGAELDSEETYSYIQCIICPVKLEKGGLQYRRDDNTIGTIHRDWIVGKPRIAFIYPAFEHRTTEAGHIMYYTKDPMNPASELITQTLKCKNKLTITQTQHEFKNLFFRATKSDEITEEYLQRVNVDFRKREDLGHIDEYVTDMELKGILAAVNIPDGYAEDIIEGYKAFWKEEYPRLYHLYDPNKVAAYNAQAKKNKGRELLSRAARELSNTDLSGLVEDIDKYLESTR